MIANFEITTSLLAFWRHELYAPLNTIQGYSGLIIDELEDQYGSRRDDNVIEILSGILKFSKEIQEIIGNTLDSKILDDRECVRNIIDLRYLLEQKLINKIDQINLDVQRILTEYSIGFDSDLDKIIKSTHNLKSLLSGNLLWLKDFSPTVEPSQPENNFVGLKKSTDQNKSTLSDIEQSLRIIRHTHYDRQYNPQDFKILVVDNNRSNQELLYRQLEREAYHVDTVESGEEAIQVIQDKNYDLILLDIIMPGLNGYQVLHYLKCSQWKNIPVIMISSLNEIDSITKCIEMGAEDYLPKPFNFTLLRARIDACLEKKDLQDQEKIFINQLASANKEIEALNDQLKAENIRLSTELEITRRLQQLILPKDSELREIEDIDIAGFMEPAEEVGGDYYDVHEYNGSVNISIGDITGHGLESGLLMIMVQTAIRTLIENNETDQKKLLNTLNQIIINNAKRIESERNLTLLLINYVKGTLSIAGQHEDIVIVRASGQIERIDTTYLGFPIGLEEDIKSFIHETQLSLSSGDVMILYTDGITEAESECGNQYGMERLCDTVRKNRMHPAKTIKKMVIDDLRAHIGENKILDDLTLLVLKQK
ncbi:MAG: SpoIIE family protein phosphatase [Cyanobacteria bacterium J06639_16]